MKRVLIVRIAALGDVAVSSTVLTRVRAEHPGARVTWLCGERASDLVTLLGVDEIITANEHRLLRGSPWQRVREIGAMWRKIAGRRFDAVILLHADLRYRILTLPVLTGRTVALRHGGRRRNPVLTRYRGDEYARLLDTEEVVGPVVRRFSMADVRSVLHTNSERTDILKPAVAIVPGGARNVLRDDILRRWPLESYVALAARLVAAGCNVTLVGDDNDEWVRERFHGIRVRDEIGKRSIVDTLSLLRDCDVVVTHDTGPLHFARLVRTPIVALFGPTDPRHVVGDDAQVTSVWGGAHLACRPCYDGRSYAKCSSNLCMQSITVDAVLAAVMQRIGAHATRAEGDAARFGATTRAVM